MKTFKQLQESENGQIYNTSPKTYKEWEDPEILIVEFGRRLYSQLKDKINPKSPKNSIGVDFYLQK